MESILFFVFLILAMLGLAELIHTVKQLILYPKKQSGLFTVVFLDNNSPQCQLESIYQKFLWHGMDYTGKIIAINSNLDSQNFSECELIAKKYNLTFCSLEELPTQLADANNYK